MWPVKRLPARKVRASPHAPRLAGSRRRHATAARPLLRRPAASFWRKFRNPVVLRLSANPSHVEFSPAAPHDLAVTAGARVSLVSAAAAAERRAISKF